MITFEPIGLASFLKVDSGITVDHFCRRRRSICLPYLSLLTPRNSIDLSIKELVCSKPGDLVVEDLVDSNGWVVFWWVLNPTGSIENTRHVLRNQCD